MAGKTDERAEPGSLASPVPAVPDAERLAAHMAALGQITPAVAHDLRGPINAMVFNLEILKETIASGRGDEPGGRDKLLRYVEVLRQELGRLHRALEAFLSLTTGRGDKIESFDLREPVRELASVMAGPARKQQVQVTSELPDHPVQVEANRYLVRQALLQVALAALGQVGRGQALQVALADGGDVARLWIGGPSAPSDGMAAEDPFDGLRTAALAAGAYGVALAVPLLAQQGSRVEPSEREGGARGYEIEWRILPNGLR